MLWTSFKPIKDTKECRNSQDKKDQTIINIKPEMNHTINYKMSKLSNWSLDYWLADRLVPELWKLTNRSPNFTNVSQIGP